MASESRRLSHDHHLRAKCLDRPEDLLAGAHLSNKLQVLGGAEHQAESVTDHGVVIDGKAGGRRGHPA